MASSQSATWNHPDFADPRFVIQRVNEAATCRHEGCDRRADHLVEYTMRRDGWAYEYEAGYCDEHLPTQARERIEL